MTRNQHALLGLLVVIAVAGTAAQQSGDDTVVPSFNPVTAERLVNADAEPHNWLMYSGNYMSQRYSGLTQIDRNNVDGLEIAWVHQLQALDRCGRRHGATVLAIRAPTPRRINYLLWTKQPWCRCARRPGDHEHP